MTRVAFVDFWKGLRKDSMLHQALARMGVRIVDHPVEATCIIHSDFGSMHRSFDGRRIYYSGENVIPDFHACDFALTSAWIDHERHYRLPYWVFSCRDLGLLVRPDRPDVRTAMERHRGFCSFIASNPRAPERNRFFKALHRRRPVSSGGRVFNTMGRSVVDKLAFLAEHRFTICFENTSSPGYTTEKLIDAFLAGTIPIYWGNPMVGEEFNAEALIDAGRYGSTDSLVDAVIDLADDAQRCATVLTAPFLRGNVLPAVASLDALCDALERAFALPLANRPLGRNPGRLRSHCYRSPFHQSAVSLGCRLDALAWNLRTRWL
jgi:hypothetical protein